MTSGSEGEPVVGIVYDQDLLGSVPDLEVTYSVQSDPRESQLFKIKAGYPYSPAVIEICRRVGIELDGK